MRHFLRLVIDKDNDEEMQSDLSVCMEERVKVTITSDLEAHLT